MQPNVADHGWVSELCTSLLTFRTASDAVDLAVRLGGRRQDAERLAADLSANTKFRSAQQAAVQLKCRNWLLAAYASLANLKQEPGTIDSVQTIDQTDFLVDYYSSNKPLFVPGVASNWPAVNKWTPEYLKTSCGSEMIEVMTERASAPVHAQNTSDGLRRSMHFADYVDLVYSGARSNDYYLVARNRFFTSPGAVRLLEDVGALPFVNTRSDVSDIKLWLGPAGTYTPLHYDGRNNVLVQVVGRKVIRLYAPYYSEFMEQTMPWYAQTDPGVSPEAILQGGHAVPPQVRVRLGPGDGLFIPVGWWHAVAAESVSISLNFHDFGVPNEYKFS